RVFVTDANNVEQQLFTTTSGSQSLNWIQAEPQHYTFKLWDYSSGSRGALLATVNISVPAPAGPPSGTLKTDPCQIILPKTTCTISIIWTMQNVTTAKIYVTDALNNDVPVSTVTSLSGSMSIPWIESLPQKYTFHLWDYSANTRGVELANASVAVTKSATQA